MEALALAATPLIVNLLTAGVKRVRKLANSKRRRALIRTAVAALSLIAVLGKQLATDGAVDVMAIETAAETFITAAAATGTYYLSKG